MAKGPEAMEVSGRPVGFAVPGWSARPRPPSTPIEGRYCRIERLSPERHAAELFAASTDAPESWTYLPQPPPADFGAYRRWVETAAERDDPFFHAVIDGASGLAAGVAALMRIDPANGVIEVGGIHYGPSLQRTRAGTEAILLLARRVFDELGYRRFEWKCDSLNAPSRRAALRYGFTFEGIFRQAVVYKGRNRDTAWFSIIDREWPRLREGYARWLNPANFDAEGRQRRSLTACLGGDG
ncbi:MAG: GNAT family protein [Rhodospirillales bacterium]|nr:GNAT family protein [Rhodospirillales bacterium]